MSLKGMIDYFRFLALTEKTLQQISFTEFLGCTLDICLVGYYVIMVCDLDLDFQFKSHCS